MPRLSALSDRRLALLIALAALLIYLVTLAPGVVNLADDSLEFQYLGWPAAIPHPTGYPLYATLLTALAHLVPIGELAWRANALSALFASAAVALTYLVGRGMALSRIGAGAAAAFIALSPTFWANATVAEVYALHLCLVAALLFALLRWSDEVERGGDGRWLIAAAAVVGLGLAHHRMIVLWLPAALLFWGLIRRRSAARPATPWAALVLALLLPLAFYLYLPLRAQVGSLDGGYSEVGFGCWVTACQYQNTFFGQSNPLADPVPPRFFLTLTAREIGWLVIALALVGGVWLGRDRPPWLLLVGGILTNALFAMAYVVPDRGPFWLPALWGIALLAGGGLSAVQRRLTPRLSPTLTNGALAVLLALLLLWQARGAAPDYRALAPIPMQHGERVNGRDMLAQPLPENSVIIGLQGEAVYLDYLKATAPLTPMVRTVGLPTDPPGLRLEAVASALAAGESPFLTRPLAGAEARWSLSAFGPLIAVHDTPFNQIPASFAPLAIPLNDAVTLVGWRSDGIVDEAAQRLSVVWRVEQPIAESWKLSARWLDGTGTVVGQQDLIPVHNAYPTTAWRAGELIVDAYRLPPRGSVGGSYQLILYRAESGEEIGRAEWQP